MPVLLKICYKKLYFAANIRPIASVTKKYTLQGF